MIGVEQRNDIVKVEPETPCLAMRAREAAKAIGVSERTLWEWAASGDIPHVRRGKVVLFPVDSLREWLRQQAQTDAEEDVEISE